MNKPDFGPVLAAFREQDDERERRQKRRAAWIARPLNERESVIADNLLYCLRGREDISEFKTEDVAEEVMDHFRDAEGMVEFTELLNAVAEEEPQRAWTVLQKVLHQVAKVKHEQEV